MKPRIIAGKKYFVINQNWNVNIPNTIYARKEGLKIFWYLNDREIMAYDFEASYGESWELILPKSDENEPLHIIVTKLNEETMDNLYALLTRRCFSFECVGYNDIWYELYSENEGSLFIRWYQPEVGEWFIGVISDLNLGYGQHTAYTYDSTSLSNSLKNLFGNK